MSRACSIILHPVPYFLILFEQSFNFADWIKFLHRLADRINEIRITLNNNRHSIRQILSVIQSLLAKNCNYFHLEEKISFADAEQLIKVRLDITYC